MKITYREKEIKNSTIIAADIPIGEVFHGRIKNYSDKVMLFMRTHNAIIDLANPIIYWSRDLDVLKIQDYKPAIVELIVHE